MGSGPEREGRYWGNCSEMNSRTLSIRRQVERGYINSAMMSREKRFLLQIVTHKSRSNELAYDTPIYLFS